MDFEPPPLKPCVGFKSRLNKSLVFGNMSQVAPICGAHVSCSSPHADSISPPIRFELGAAAATVGHIFPTSVFFPVVLGTKPNHTDKERDGRMFPAPIFNILCIVSSNSCLFRVSRRICFALFGRVYRMTTHSLVHASHRSP